MKVVFNPKKLRDSHETAFFIVDFIMMGLIIINLLWLTFDTLFTSEMIRDFLASVLPDFTAFYAREVHANFVFYDLIFVSIFVTELVIRWAISIYRKDYHRWFFYPFIHWYDVLGCIPVGGFRWLRLLRVFSILYRLQKYDIIDISNAYPIRAVRKYFNVLVEEVSDRVVINVLDGVQDEIKTGNPVAGKVLQQVLMPQKQIIIDWLSERINSVTTSLYEPRRDELEQYVNRIVSEAIDDDPKVAALDRIPLVGDATVRLIETTVSDIVFGVVDRLVQDVGHEDTDILVKELADVAIDQMLEPSAELSEAGRKVLIDALEIVKDEVRVQKWKLDEDGLP